MFARYETGVELIEIEHGLKVDSAENCNDSQPNGHDAEAAQPDRQFPISIDGKMCYTAEEARKARRERAEQRARFVRKLREDWLDTPQGRLCVEFYKKFREYEAYLAEHPDAHPLTMFAGADFHEHDAFKEVLRLVGESDRARAERDAINLRRAHLAARCRHHHADGRRCGSPRLRGKKLCYWHQRLEEAKALKVDLGPMEDPDSIQMAIMKLQRAVIDGSLDFRQTGQLAYTIQLAAWNVTRTKMARAAKEEKSE